MKAYRVILVYKILADSETDAQIRALKASFLNLIELDCEEMQEDHTEEPSELQVPDNVTF